MTEFTYQVDRINDNLYFIGEINIESVNQLTQELHKLEADKNNSTANLYVTSDGGSCTNALKFYDLLQKSNLTITIHILGLVASSATIFAFTKHRTVMSKHSSLLFHELWTDGHLSQVSAARSHLGHSELLIEQFLNIYKTKTNKITRETLVVDKYLTADEALEMKIVDEVI